MKQVGKNLIDAIMEFVKSYNRLPLMREDDLNIIMLDEDGEEVVKVLRARGQIREIFKKDSDFIKYMFDENLITYDKISETLGYESKEIQKIVDGKGKKPNVDIRRAVDIYFCNDYAEKKYGKYLSKCEGCKHPCKQLYFADLHCSQYEKK